MRLAESVDRLLGVFQAIAKSADPKSGYSPRLPGDQVGALVACLAGRGDVLAAGALKTEYERLVRSLAGAGELSGRRPTLALTERREGFQTAVDRIVGLLEKVKAEAGGRASAAIEAREEHERRLRDLVATYDPRKTRPTVADKGIGHILHVGHDCERLMIELLKALFAWEDQEVLDDSAVRSNFEALCAASEEADQLTRDEGKVLTLAAGSLFGLGGQQKHWQSGHQCLFEVARTMPTDFSQGANLQEAMENHLLRRTVADWPMLFAQVQRERVLAESGTEVSLQPIALIQAIQQVQTDDAPPGRLDGTFPEGSPAANRREAAKKGARTRKAKKEEKAARRTDAINAAKLPPEPKPEAKLTWKVHHEKDGRTQQETAAIMSERLGYSVNQQWVSDRLKECKRWVEKTGLSVDDIEDLPGGKERLMPPAAIDLGPRQDSRPSVQRQKAEQLREGSDDAGWKRDAERVKPDEAFDGSGYGPTTRKK